MSAIPDGWVLVPRRPTPEIEAAWQSIDQVRADWWAREQSSWSDVFYDADSCKAAAQSDYESRIRSALIASPAQVVSEEWQDISTAPKDGTWIEAWRPPAEVGVYNTRVIVRWCHFDDDGGAAWAWPDDVYEVDSAEGRRRAIEMIENGDFYEDAAQFTHWRPYSSPTPPALSHDKGE